MRGVASIGHWGLDFAQHHWLEVRLRTGARAFELVSIGWPPEGSARRGRKHTKHQMQGVLERHRPAQMMARAMGMAEAAGAWDEAHTELDVAPDAVTRRSGGATGARPRVASGPWRR